MIREPARVRLELESHPENVALVRAVLTGVAEAAALDDELLADLKTAVSEACNNAALHAYDSSGPMAVDVAVLHDGISVAVTDYGRGIKRISAAEHRMGLGLAVISALADRAEFTTPERGGTEVRMWFARKAATTEVFPAAALRATEAAPIIEQSHLELSLVGDVVAWVSPVSLTRYVLGRLFRMLAATSRFSVARVMDLQTVNDAVAKYAEVAGHDGIGVALSSSSRRLVLTSGPFMSTLPGPDGHDGDSSTFSLLEARRQLLEGIPDELNFEQLNDDELLHLVLTDAGQGSRRDPA